MKEVCELKHTPCNSLALVCSGSQLVCIVFFSPFLGSEVTPPYITGLDWHRGVNAAEAVAWFVSEVPVGPHGGIVPTMGYK